jgi:hypothetical protein
VPAIPAASSSSYDQTSSAAPHDEGQMLFAAAEELYEQQDYEGALEMLDILTQTKKISPDAQRLRERCRHYLQKAYIDYFGDANTCPYTLQPLQALQHANLDHRAGFLLSRMDGRTTLRDLLLLSNLDEFDFLRILYQLAEQQFIAF